MEAIGNRSFSTALPNCSHAGIAISSIGRSKIRNLDIEVVQFSQFINRFFAVLESAVTIANQDTLMSDDYDIEYLYDYPMANRLLETHIGAAWFKEEAPLTFSEEFLENIRKFQLKRLQP